jgi:Co/Zn/Cd efflux system component
MLAQRDAHHVGVLLAAGGVAWSGTRWPDLGIVIAVIVLDSALHILGKAIRQIGG